MGQFVAQRHQAAAGVSHVSKSNTTQLVTDMHKKHPSLVVLSLAFLFSVLTVSKGQDTSRSFVRVKGELQKWHKVTLVCTGPDTHEQATPNPFRDFRLNVTFEHPQSGKRYLVPGYYAADGDAANSSADRGNQWHVHFSPDETGTWTYEISFRAENFIAASEKADLGRSAGFVDGSRGTFEIAPTNKTGRDFRAHGRLQYVGQHYLRFAETGRYFLKCGADAPENLLAYADFDGDFKNDGHQDHLVKTWQPHVQDWGDGDPTWGDGRGKALVGATNYLASKGMNSISFLTMNILGDDQNVFPYTDYDQRERFDVSKLAQWEVIFSHAQRRGLFLHFKTQEHENQGLLDGGGIGLHRKMYYRELIARFGHHLALNWNLGEEIGEWGKDLHSLGQDSHNRRGMAQYFYDHDPYHHLIVIHNGAPFDDMLGNQSKLTGASVQTSSKEFKFVHGAVAKWRKKSADAGRPWVVCCDEPGDATHALITDAEDPEHNQARQNALWGALMAGGAGIEWYFGYAHPHSDLLCQDWRSRDKMWDQSRHALEFFTENAIPFAEMIPDDSLVAEENNYCFYKANDVYVVYLKKGGMVTLDLSHGDGDFSLRWFNPRTGRFEDKQETTRAGKAVQLGPAPRDVQSDWVVLLRRASKR